MSAPSVLERCRMALAEIGMAEDLVQPTPGVSGSVTPHNSLPLEMRWMLWSTAAWPEKASCWPCFLHWYSHRWTRKERFAIQDACRADRPFQRVSCGVSPEVQP